MKPVQDDFRVYVLSHDFALNTPPLSTEVDRSHEPCMPHLFQTEKGESKIVDDVLMKCVTDALPLLGVFKLAARSLPTSPTICMALHSQSVFCLSYVKYLKLIINDLKLLLSISYIWFSVTTCQRLETPLTHRT